MTRVVVLDFDGTLTDAEEEGRPYRDGYLGDLATLTGAPFEEVLRLAERFEGEVLEERDKHGWVFDGAIVAPASVDPYLRMMPVARRLLDHFGAIPSDRDRSRLLDGILYKYNYPKSAICFREGALAFLEGLAGDAVWIVTNSATEPVQKKVRALSAASSPPGALDWLVERVHGDGKKYVIDPAFDGVPESLSLPGLGRPVLLRRRLYFETLERLLAEAGSDWEDLVVVGDIFELDLCLPLHMGARVGLMVNEFTPDYERSYLEAQPRAELLGSLEEAGAFVGA